MRFASWTLIPLFIFSSMTNAQSNKVRVDEAIVRIGIYQGKQLMNSGYGALISGDGEFLTSRSLVREGIRYPHLYNIRVFNKDGTELSNLKLSRCGFEMEMDVCLMKVDYTSLYWFRFAKEKPKVEQKLITLENDQKIKHLDALYASTQLNNFTNNMLLRILSQKEVPRGAPVFDKQGMLYGIGITYGSKSAAKEILHAIPVGELELFILMSKFFYPLRRNKDTNYFLSNLEKMLREKKTMPGGSMSDLRKLRTMEQRVQYYWPSYCAEGDAQSVQELQRLYELSEKLGEDTKFRSPDDYTKEENAQRIMGKKKSLQDEISQKRQKIQEMEMKLQQKGKKSNSVLKNQIAEFEAQKVELANKNKEGKELINKRKSELEGALDNKTKDLILKGLEITKENITENEKKMGKIDGKISALKNKLGKGNSKSPEELDYERETRSLQILEERVKELDQRAYEFFEDAI